MKISHKSKKITTPHPHITALIADILAKDKEELPDFLASIDSWKWPRSDLNIWIKVLNKFDQLLEDCIRDYEVDKLQTREFDQHTKQLLCEILKFERFLLENSTNRKMFNSYDRLNGLLFTSDLDVLIATLFLLLRPSQQYSSQPAVSHSLHISTTRLECLARFWPTIRDHGVDMLDFVSDKTQEKVENIPPEASEVNLTFYRKSGENVESTKSANDPSSSTEPKTPRAESSTQSAGPVAVHLGPLSLSSRSAMEILNDAVKSYQVPENERYELMCRIRMARSLGVGRSEERQKLMIARLLAIAIYAHTHNETQAQSSLFLYETDLLARLSDLLQLDRGVPVLVQTAAIAAMDAIARYRGKILEVLAAINAGVNHGIAMSLFRKTVAEISNPESTLPHMFVDALLTFVIYLASHTSGGNMVVSAGLVPLLIQIIGITLPQRLAVVSKTMQLVDNVLYGFVNAFQMFCNSHGVEALTERIRHEVQVAIDEHGKHTDAHVPSGTYGLLPVSRASVLKHILRSMLRMMQSSGTAEGMRTLIDSSLLKSVETIIEYRGVFGPTILPIAINIIATFVHNEPTSLATIQEAKVPETIYNALEAGLEPSIEVIQSIPNAIGAMCLNQAGQDQLASRPTVIPALFSIFTSERHLRVLQDKESAAIIGAAIDELIRHHPSLKTLVFNAVVSVIGKIETLGNAYVPPKDIEHWYKIHVVQQRSEEADDVIMGDVPATPDHPPTESNAIQVDEPTASNEEPLPKSHENVIVDFIYILGRFLEGLFQHSPHCKDFITDKDGLNTFTRLLSLPCLPYDLSSSQSFDSLVQVIHTMAEVAPTETHNHLVQQIKQSVRATEGFWQKSGATSTFLNWVDSPDEAVVQNANVTFRKLITLHNCLTLLADVCTSFGYTHGQSPISLLQALSGSDMLEMIVDLGSVHRNCLFENITLKNELPSKGVKDSSSRSDSPEGIGRLGNSPSIPNGNLTEGGASDWEGSGRNTTEGGKMKTPQEQNAHALRYIAIQIPNTLVPLFQALGRTVPYVVARRGHDTSMRQQAISMAETIATVMCGHLADRQMKGLSSHAYNTFMLRLVAVLLSDERGSQINVQITLLYQFRQRGGVESILRITRHFVDVAARLANVKSADQSDTDKQELVHVYGGLKVALPLLQALVSYKPTSESPSMVTGSSADRSETHRDYFEPHDFLVKLRLAIAPLIADIWQSDWLVSSPPGVSKHVIQSMFAILAGENEEGRTLMDAEVIPPSGSMLRPTVTAGPDENRVRQLTDMGFPRSAAVRALTRLHNNISAATEYLLSQTALLGAESDDENDNESNEDGGGNDADETPVEPAVAETSGTAEASGTPAITGTAEGDNITTTENDLVDSNTHVDESTTPEKTAAERREELSTLRTEWRSNVGALALRLLDVHSTLVFEIRQFFVGQSTEQTSAPEPTKAVIADIEKFMPAAYDINEEPLSLRFRLLALILTESPKSILRLTGSNGQSLMEMLDALLLSQPIGLDKDQPLPKWLASLLLVMESLLVLSEEPQAISVPLSNEPIEEQPLFTGPLYTEVRAHLLELSLRLLGLPVLQRDDYLATLRIVVFLTRPEEGARQFKERNGLSLLLQSFRNLSGIQGASACQSYTAIILRHLTEDTVTLDHFMRQEVKRVLTSRRDGDNTSNYIRTCVPIASRDPRLFVSVTKSLCQLSSPDATARISLKPAATAPGPKAEKEQERHDDSAMQIDDSTTTTGTSNEHVEMVVHFLLNELLRFGKAASDSIKIMQPSPQATQPSVAQHGEETNQEHSGGPTKVSGADISHDSGQDSSSNTSTDFSYACFLMQCLTELLFSYDQCKSAFLSFGKKKGTSKETHVRSKPVALHFLLSDLVSVGAFNVEPKYDTKKRVMLCNWAMSVIVALCVDSTAASSGSNNMSVDLSAVRKAVLDAIAKAIKEAPPGETIDSRYGRLLALADLCHRLLTVRFNAGVNNKTSEETPLHLAKMMLEKNFVAILTNALSSVDLNYPNVRSLIAAKLRPLEHLTKVAIKMGRASDKSKAQQEKNVTSTASLSTDSSDEDEDDDIDPGMDREETPDLYRNSSLGMYGGEMDDAVYSSDEAMDEDEEDEDDNELDYDDEGDSDDTSNTDEEVDDVEDLTMPPRESTDEWHEDEDMDEDDGEENDDEGTDDDMDAGEDVAENPEIVWPEDIEPDGDGPEAIGDEDDDLGDMAAVGDRSGDDEAEIDTEEEDDVVGDLGELEETAGLGARAPEDTFMFGRSTNRPTHRDRIFYTGIPLTHREGDTDLHMFTRSRRSGDPDTTTHPLLVEPTNLTQTSPTRVQQRRAQRGPIEQFNNGVFQMLDDAFGEGVAGFFQHIVERTVGVGGGMVAADIHVDIPAAMHFMTGAERGVHRGSRRNGASYTIREARTPSNRTDSTDFGPLPTIQRLTEEAKIMHGKHLYDRITRLSNHIILSLLPDAREENVRKEKERAEIQEKAKAEAAAKEKAVTDSTQSTGPVDGPMETVAPSQETSEAVPVVSRPDVEDATMSIIDQAVEAVPASSEPLVHASSRDEQEAGPESDTVISMDTASERPEGEQRDDVTQEERSRTPQAQDTDGPSTTATTERVTVLIHGNPVDITNTGIDPTFLEALPDDMREEVLNQHFREQRSARVEQPAESQISPEFLEALPPELRAEILQQERLERSRRERETTNVASSGPVDMDAATFIASLDPNLRQVVLLEQDDGFLQTLPSHMLAEVGAYREAVPRMHLHPRSETQPQTSNNPTPRKLAPPRDAIQLLDRSGVASLVRLLFYPKLRRNVLHKIMLNLCENTKTRTELFNLLLSVLHDGTGDVAMVDRSFSQLSFKPTKGTPQTPSKVQSRPRTNTDYDYSASSLNIPNEVPPDLVAQRCLDALASIVVNNDVSSLFFLTEHELPAGLKRPTSKKGKGKEKQAPQSYYPIVLLLSLLDRQALLKTPSIMDSVAGLLDAITRPLANLRSERANPTDTTPTVPAVLNGSTNVQGATDTASPRTGALAENPSTEPTITQGPNDRSQPESQRKEEAQSMEEKLFLANPPQIPHPSLRLIVNILTVGECSGRTFQHTLALIQHLSYLPDARDVIAQELKSKAQEFGQNLYADLEALILALQENHSDDELPSPLASKFSPASSEQAKLLRVLKTIDYMYSYKVTQTGSSASKAETEEEGLAKIYESFNFAPLWQKLGDCLTVVEQKPNVEHVATILLPLIESLMVVCKHVGLKSTSAPLRVVRSPSSPRMPLTPTESMEDLFVTFTDNHRKVLNLMVRNNPSLMSGSFSLLVQNPRVLDFDNKRNYFNQQLRRRPRDHYGALQLNVRRAQVFQDSYHIFIHKSGDQIKYGKLSVRFYNEEGVDAGGVTREWFQILARQMFDVNYALFEPCAADTQTYQPNRASAVNPDHLSYFKFVGRVIGKAIFDGRLMDAHFARSLYRQLLGKKVDYRDVEWVDPEYYKSLCWILDNDPTVLDLTFITEVDEFGRRDIIPLKENGTSIPVTLENRKEYVQLSAQYRLTDSIKDQIEKLLEGFYEIIPKDLISIFNEQEVELLIAGTPDIDVDEWRAATEYNGYSSSDPVIVWWWRALKSFSRDERAKVLSFATGTSRVPLGGFTDLQGVQGVQRFSIHKAYGQPDRLPQAHTCFNQIDLPQYTSYEMLRQQLLLAINEGGEGFGFA